MVEEAKIQTNAQENSQLNSNRKLPKWRGKCEHPSSLGR